MQEVLDLLQANELPAALEKCKTLISTNPADAELQHLLGLVYAKTGDLHQALAAFSQAIKLNPKQAIYHNNISNAYKMLGNFDFAIRHLHEALRLDPNNGESHNNLGSLFYSTGQIKLAIPMFEKAIRVNPYSWEAHYNLANCLIKQNLVLQAIPHYQTAIKLNPKHVNAKLNLAMAWVNEKNYTEALPLLIEAAANNPQHAELQGHLAEAYLDLGRSDEATKQYLKALNLEPDRAEWHHNLAVLYLRAKQSDLAKSHFNLSLTLQPDNQTAKHMLSALESEVVKTSTTAPAEYISDLFDQYAGYYNQHVTQKLKYQVPAMLRQAISKYIDGSTRAQNILDLGCGTGLCGIYFRDLANFLIGVDLSAEMLAQAKTLGAYDGLCRANILQMLPGYNLAVFDLIIAADVFVYIGDLQPIFAMLVKALRTNGKLAFTVEDIDDKNNFALQTTGRFAHSAKYIASLCAEFGFTIGTQDKITLREQDNEPIIGRLYVLLLNALQ